MGKFIEIIIEPSKVYVKQVFRVKVKARKYIIYSELKLQKVSKLKQYTVLELKGVY